MNNRLSRRRATHLLRFRQGAPGDCVAASALVRDLFAARPDLALDLVHPSAEELYRFDPRVADPSPDAEEVVIDFRAVTDRSRTDATARYVYGPHECFEDATGIFVPRGPARPDLALAPAERARPCPEPYAAVLTGTKVDIPAKAVPRALVAAAVANTPWTWVQLGQIHDGLYPHVQVEIPGARNMLGKTSLRELVRWVYHAEAVLCLTSLPMLLASAFGRPCVVLAGGREDPWFHADNGCVFLHAVGRLPCCAGAGCRAAAVLPGHRETPFPPGYLCADPFEVSPGEWVGRCTTLLSPEAVAAALTGAAGKLHPPSGQNN